MSRKGAASSTAALVDAWCSIDEEASFLEADREAIEATRALRALVAETFVREPSLVARDALHALGAMGRLFAERRASPTLAAATVDGLWRSLPTEVRDAVGSDVIASARGAVIESYFRAVRDGDAAGARLQWDYPSCAVRLDETVAAVVAGCPGGEHDDEVLTAWASKVAHGLSLDGVRRAVVAGNGPALDALTEALEIAGIERLEPARRPTGPRKAPR